MASGGTRGAVGEELPRMSLLEHLTELRNRLLYMIAGVTVGFSVCWGFREEIVEFLVRPIQPFIPEGQKLKVFTPTESFVLYMKIVAVAACFLVAPFIIYQAWRFVAPGLYRRERGWSLVVVTIGSILFIGGGAFAYYVASPFALEFLVNFGSGQFDPDIRASYYLSFLLTMVLGLGLMFELPIFIFALAQIGVVTPRWLMRQFRWAVLIIFIAAAIITPTPDPFNLCLFALPAVFLYLLGVGAAALVQGKKKPAEAGEEEAEEAE
jgi:sec-independent protein translocase protein TatC